MIESPKVISEILAHHPDQIVSGLRTESGPFADNRLFLTISDGVFRDLSELGTPQGALAVIEMAAFQDTISSALPWALALDGVSDPRNLGGILRSAKAFDCPMIFLTPDCADPFHPDSLRVAATPIYTIPFARLDAGMVSTLTATGLTPTLMQMTGSPITASSAFPSRPLIVLGSEGSGIRSPWLQDLAGAVSVRIEMNPAVESLNVSVATGIVLHMFRHAQFREG